MPSRASLPQRPRSLSARRDVAFEINRRLTALYPDAACALDYSNSFELLTATVLSAQTTDAQVNTVTPRLFEAYPGPEALADADCLEFEDILHPLGFYRAKTASCIGLAVSLCASHGGEVPQTLEELVKLPGVGRRTANVVLGNAFDVPGTIVDTHVGRLMRCWTWTRSEDPVKIEADIVCLIPESEQTQACHRIIFHGCQVCRARKSAYGVCALADICPSYPLLSGRA